MTTNRTTIPNQSRTRRIARRGAAAAALALSIGLGQTTFRPTPAVAEQSPWNAFHDATQSSNDTKSATLKTNGYRPVSVSIYGTSQSPTYGGVWVKRVGPDFKVLSKVTAADLPGTLSTLAASHYYPSLVSATGSGSGTVFEIVAEQSDGPVLPTFRHDITPATLDKEVGSAQKAKLRPRAVAHYGTAAEPRFAMTLWPADTAAPWDVSVATGADLGDQTYRYAESGLRPDQIVPGPGGFLSVWRDDAINGWSVAAGLTSADYQQRATDEDEAGRMIMRVAATGAGTAARFTAVFAWDDRVIPRSCRATGTENASMKAFDDYMTTMLTEKGVKVGQLAVVRQGKLVHNRAYTCADPFYETASPTSMLRIASTSKPLTSIGIHQLVDADKLELSDTVQSILNLTQKNGQPPVDARLAKVTVDHLLSMTSGLPYTPYDPHLAADLGVSLPITQQHLGQWTAAHSMRSEPGTVQEYNNLNFVLLGRIIEAKTGMSYESAMREFVFKPLGITRPRLGGTLLSQRAQGEVRYHASNWVNDDGYPRHMIGRSVMTPSQPLTSAMWGPRNMPLGGGAGAWIMSAADHAKVMASLKKKPKLLFPKGGANTVKLMFAHPAGTAGGSLRGWYGLNLTNSAGTTVKAYEHNGGLEGTAALAVHRSDGLTFYIVVNGDMAMHGSIQGVDLNAIANTIKKWPTVDEFPNAGIPKF